MTVHWTLIEAVMFSYAVYVRFIHSPCGATVVELIIELPNHTSLPSKYKCCHFQRHSASSVCSSLVMTCKMCSIMGNAISYRHGAASGRQAHLSRYTRFVCSVAAVDNDLSVQIGTFVWATPCLATLLRLFSEDHSNNGFLS